MGVSPRRPARKSSRPSRNSMTSTAVKGGGQTGSPTATTSTRSSARDGSTRSNKSSQWRPGDPPTASADRSGSNRKGLKSTSGTLLSCAKVSEENAATCGRLGVWEKKRPDAHTPTLDPYIRAGSSGIGKDSSSTSSRICIGLDQVREKYGTQVGTAILQNRAQRLRRRSLQLEEEGFRVPEVPAQKGDQLKVIAQKSTRKTGFRLMRSSSMSSIYSSKRTTNTSADRRQGYQLTWTVPVYLRRWKTSSGLRSFSAKT